MLVIVLVFRNVVVIKKEKDFLEFLFWGSGVGVGKKISIR